MTVSCNEGNPQVAAGMGVGRSGVRTYVVTRDSALGGLLARQLARLGHDTSVFWRPRLAWAAFVAARREPELLLTDVLMPEISGLELMRRCRRLHPGLKVIFLGWSLDPRTARAFPRGSTVALDKPISPGRLEEALATLGLRQATGMGERSADSGRGGNLRQPGNEHERSRLVYVVDDKVKVAEMVATAMREAGFRVEVFHSPVAAAASLASAPVEPALLIADFSMPEMDGLELMRRCRELCPGLKTVLVSGTVTAKVLRGRGVGADVVLDKPLSVRQLIEAAEALFNAALEAAADEVRAARGERLTHAHSGRGSLVYVVDDEVVLAQMVARQLLRGGYRAQAFGHPAQALASLSSADPKPVLLITDLEMPGMDGVELVRRCRRLCPDLRVILMIGSAPFRRNSPGHSALRPDAVLNKPFKPEELMSAVEGLGGIHLSSWEDRSPSE